MQSSAAFRVQYNIATILVTIETDGVSYGAFWEAGIVGDDDRSAWLGVGVAILEPSNTRGMLCLREWCAEVSFSLPTPCLI